MLTFDKILIPFFMEWRRNQGIPQHLSASFLFIFYPTLALLAFGFRALETFGNGFQKT